MEHKLSIIIPAFFEEKMLKDLLSKFNKNITEKYNCEIIVSDGGSTDNTITIARQYTDLVVENKSAIRQNIAQGRNSGATIASGDILIFLNADCMPADINSFFENIAAWASTPNSADAIACKIRSFPTDELLRDKLFYFLHNDYVRFLNLLKIGMGRGECQIVRKEIFDKVGGYNPKLVAGEDFDLYRRIIKMKGKIQFSKDIIIYESPRRFRQYGYIKTLWYWTLNSLTVIFYNKSASKEWEPIR